jgi:hypothetical protein
LFEAVVVGEDEKDGSAILDVLHIAGADLYATDARELSLLVTPWALRGVFTQDRRRDEDAFFAPL